MNRAELVQAVATKFDVSKVEATRLLEGVIETIITGTKETNECVVPGLGKLVQATTAARSGTTNGVKWDKPAGTTIKLRLSKAGKEIL